MIHVCSPYRKDKNLGKSHNEAFKNFDNSDWLCLTDWDVMFLTSDAIVILEEYALRFPETGIFTCWTNRIHPGAKDQLYPGLLNYENDSIRDHMAVAEFVKQNLYKTTKIHKVISGFLMMIKKSTWNEIKFTEDMKCLGVDNDYSKKILFAGKSIERMDGLYVFHNYRMKNGISDKKHLL